MVSNRRRGERLVAVAFAGIMALNFPLLDLFDRVALVFGVPLLYLYLFLAWALLIGAIAAISERKVSADTPGTPPRARPGD